MAKNKPVPTHAGGRWTKSRYFAFIRSALRRAWSRYPVRFDALKSVRRAYSGPNTKQKWEFQCAACKQWKMQKEVQVDHVVECGSLNDFSDLPTFTERLFPISTDGLAVLCKSCHKQKTQEERKKRQ